MPSVEPDRGLELMNLRSRHEPTSRVRCLTDLQVPCLFLFLIEGLLHFIHWEVLECDADVPLNLHSSFLPRSLK